MDCTAIATGKAIHHRDVVVQDFRYLNEPIQRYVELAGRVCDERRGLSRVRASGRISRVLGRTGINVMTRLMGLILAAMAVEIMADGLTKLFPLLAGKV